MQYFNHLDIFKRRDSTKQLTLAVSKPISRCAVVGRPQGTDTTYENFPLRYSGPKSGGAVDVPGVIDTCLYYSETDRLAGEPKGLDHKNLELTASYSGFFGIFPNMPSLETALIVHTERTIKCAVVVRPFVYSPDKLDLRVSPSLRGLFTYQTFRPAQMVAVSSLYNRPCAIELIPWGEDKQANFECSAFPSTRIGKVYGKETGHALSAQGGQNDDVRFVAPITTSQRLPSESQSSPTFIARSASDALEIDSPSTGSRVVPHFDKTPSTKELKARRALLRRGSAVGLTLLSPQREVSGANPAVNSRSVAKFRDSARQIIVAGHNFQFFDYLEDALAAAGVKIQKQTWSGHFPQHITQFPTISPGDIVFCEWCLGNSIWWSRNISEANRLIIRFHAQELFTQFPQMVDFDRVDKIIFVSPEIMARAQEKFKIPESKCAYIPTSPRYFWSFEYANRARKELRISQNYEALTQVGYSPQIKNPHLALDIWRAIVQERSKSSLSFKGKRPRYVNDGQAWFDQGYYDELYAEIGIDDRLSECKYDEFVFDHYIRNGWILSTSRREGCHQAIIEAGTLGCIPLIYDWPGAREIYPGEFIFSSVDEAVELFNENIAKFADNSRAVSMQFQQRFSLANLWDSWEETLF